MKNSDKNESYKEDLGPIGDIKAEKFERIAQRRVAAQLATDRGLVSSKQSGNLRDVVLGFHKAVNLISFNLAEVFVIYRATSTCRSGSLK